MNKLIKTSEAVILASTLAACGTNTPPDFDSRPTYSETSVALIECNDPNATPKVDTVGKLAIQIACIDDDTLDIKGPKGVHLEEEILSKTSRYGKYVLSLPARCLTVELMRDGLYRVFAKQDDVCATEPKERLTATPATLVAPSLEVIN